MIPQLPSDNMYKFKAIANFLLCIGFIALSGWVLLNMEQRNVSEAYVNTQAWEDKNKEVQTQLHLVDSLISQRDSTYIVIDTTTQLLDKQTSQLFDWKLELIKERHRIKIHYWNNVYVLKNHQYDSKTQILLFIIFVLGIVFFGLSSSESFRDWKIHVQRYEDAILMKKAGVSEEKIAEHIRTALNEAEKNQAEEKKNIFKRAWAILVRRIKGTSPN
jgi:hypothetical protein